VNIGVVVVAYESATPLARCLHTLGKAAPSRGVHIVVVDNASRDGSLSVARRHLPPSQVLALRENRGFSAGVNAGLTLMTHAFVAVINPDVTLAPASLDVLADLLEAHPRAGLAAPLVTRADGTTERSVGCFPSASRERNHALGLDALLPSAGRHCPFPEDTGAVDWVSGCAWLLRAEAIREVGRLDEAFFMYFEDVDYCRRLHAAGWQVLATRRSRVEHDTGHGSRTTPALAADGGLSALRYFEKHFTPRDAARARRWLLAGWRLRAITHGVAGWMGRSQSAARSVRFRDALALARSGS